MELGNANIFSSRRMANLCGLSINVTKTSFYQKFIFIVGRKITRWRNS